MIGKAHVGALVLLVAGCAVEPSHDRSYVATGIEERTGLGLGPAAKPGEFSLPPGVSLEDGLAPDEAVALALWNNAQLQADLAALGFAHSDLLEASLLPNPAFSLLFPVGPKLLESKLNLPVDALWQRPRRVAAAKVDAQAVAEGLIQHGLGLIRDVRTAYTGLWLVQEQARIAREDAQVRQEIADLAQSRLKAGDISELVASVAHVDSLQAGNASLRFSRETVILRQRLLALVGLISDQSAFEIVPAQAAGQQAVSVEELLKTALAARPDLRAAELRIEAAGKRIGWEKSKVYNFIAIIDAKDKGEDFLTVGPGLQVEVPVFNQNNGRVARAKAEMEQAARQYEALRQSILLQVREAHTQYVAAHEEHDLWCGNIVPSLEQAAQQAQRSFETGDVSYLLVLEAKQKLLEARMRRAELAAQLQRSAAQLDYAVGMKVI
ncbi:MAG: TolC family protein [Planctomycetes bacterium]|jgi:cobalt-zinc-cadmium efflux system outer membrane protein|nr:TolC family protein [Planctomycetota bacterium]